MQPLAILSYFVHATITTKSDWCKTLNIVGWMLRWKTLFLIWKVWPVAHSTRWPNASGCNHNLCACQWCQQQQCGDLGGIMEEWPRTLVNDPKLGIMMERKGEVRFWFGDEETAPPLIVLHILCCSAVRKYASPSPPTFNTQFSNTCLHLQVPQHTGNRGNTSDDHYHDISGE